MKTTTSTPNATAMGNGNKKGIANSLSVGDIDKNAPKSVDRKDVNKWSSIEVQHWIKDQCKKFELRKATAEKFEMNGKIDINNNYIISLSRSFYDFVFKGKR